MTDATESTTLLIDASTQSLFNSLDEGVIIWTADRRIHFANDAARTITKLSLIPGSELVPMARANVRILDDQNTRITRDVLPVYKAFDGEDVPRSDMRYVDPDGQHRVLSVSAKRIYDAEGELLYVISSMRDISIRKSRESKLDFLVESAKILSLNLDFEQRLIEKAKLTVPSLADWCSMNVLTDGELKRVIVVNDEPEKMSLLNGLDDKYTRDVMYAMLKAQKPIFIPRVTDEVVRASTRSDAEFKDIQALGFSSLMVLPIILHGESVGAMTLAYTHSGRTYDESDLVFFQEFCNHLSVVFDNARLFDEIATRDKSKEIFLAALSHELRNPLAPIKSSLELLKLRETPTEIREELDIIEHQFDHMALLLNDLLDVTRFTQDRISLSSRSVELRRLIERSQRATDSSIRGSDITLHFSYPSSPISIIADETRLEQAVSNLLSNAVKFTPAGGSIWLDLERQESVAVIRVSDNGTGIAPEDLPHIFDMYYQGANSGPVNSGLGIGLLLVQRIVHMHGGTVEAKSNGRGTGSEFIIRLPIAESADEHVAKTPSRSLAHSLRIVVVDDNTQAADSLVRLLNKLGARATAVYSAHEALGSERLHEVDVFLLDVGMPQMDGYELVAALRSSGITAPIAALTGYGLTDDKKRAHEAGFSAHLTKPVGLAELNTLFEQMLTVAK